MNYKFQIYAGLFIEYIIIRVEGCYLINFRIWIILDNHYYKELHLIILIAIFFQGDSNQSRIASANQRAHDLLK